MADIATMARDFSLWLNGTYPTDVSEEAVHWRRVLKVCEEAGEVRAALGAYLHENPRKPAGSLDDVISELADCVGAALGAIEHLTGHEGRSLAIATERVRYVCERVGVATQGTRGGPAMTAPVPQAAVDAAMKVAREHRLVGSSMYDTACDCGGWPSLDGPASHVEHVAAAVVAAVQGPIKAEALREAVIAMGDDWRLCSYDRAAYDWLRDRADRIEAQP